MVDQVSKNVGNVKFIKKINKSQRVLGTNGRSS